MVCANSGGAHEPDRCFRQQGLVNPGNRAYQQYVRLLQLVTVQVTAIDPRQGAEITTEGFQQGNVLVRNDPQGSHGQPGVTDYPKTGDDRDFPALNGPGCLHYAGRHLNDDRHGGVGSGVSPEAATGLLPALR